MDSSKEYEKDHYRNINEAQKSLLQLYEETIDRIYIYASGLNLLNNEFNLSQYPTLQGVIERELTILSSQIEIQLVNGIRGSWELSQTKFGALISNQYYRSETMPDPVRTIVYNPQERALESFIQRKRDGLNLSERVFKYNDRQFRAEIENNLFAGISEGKSAAEMARDQKKYLKNSDALFRRVRDAKGKLVLSKNAKKYNRGQGVYRSAYKNALRLTVNEINMAYRKADIVRYQNTYFILGFRINLSPNHPKYDICDPLANVDYPVSFVWTGNHPFCFCYLTPILPSMEEFKAYQQTLLRGEGEKYIFKGRVTEYPESFNNYMAENVERFRSYKSLPYFMKDNPSVFKNF